MPVSGDTEIKKRALDLLLDQPQIAVGFFFMWLCGIVITHLIVERNAGFAKKKIVMESFWFRTAVGFVASASVILLYHWVAFGRIVTSVPDLAASIIPSLLILASIVFVALMWVAFRKKP